MATEIYDSDTDFEVPETYGDAEKDTDGTLLDEKNKTKVARQAMKLWESQNDRMRVKEEQWLVNEWRRTGYSNARLTKESDDLQDVRAWLPPNATPDTVASVNKAATLCRRFTSLMFADPPVPEASPYSGEDEDIAAAEFTTRMLVDLQSASNLNDIKAHRRAFDRGHTFGSGFIRYFVEPKGGERVPIEVSAGFNPGAPGMGIPARRAEHIDDAINDPTTGMPWPNYMERYVRPDGSLTDEPSEAATKRLPTMRSEVLTGRNVRLLPHTAEDVWEADGCQVVTFRTWGEIKATFPEMKRLSEERRNKLFNYKPKRSRYLMSAEQQKAWSRKPERIDDRLVLVLTTYYSTHADYPKGAYVVTLGNSETVVQEEWCVGGPDGIEICLPVPLTQHKMWEEGEDDAYATATMKIIGPGNEIRAHVIANLFDHYKRILNRKIFLPFSSTIQPRDLRLPGSFPIRMNPGGKPEYEDIPSFPADGMNLFSITSEEIENQVGLPQVAQGLESPQVQSGRHAQAIISQVHAGLAEIRQNIIDAYERACHIQTMLVRAFFDAPMRIGWVGEDGAYKEKQWRGADLRFTSDIRLAPGSLTMLSPVAKAQLAEHFAQLGLIGADDLYDLEASNLGGILGIQDDPFVMRIRRQIAAWKDGPPDGWQPQFEQQPVVDPATGQPMTNPITGQVQMETVQRMDPVTASIWTPVPADMEPNVALKRLRELAKTMSSSRYLEQPPEWRWGIEQEFIRAKTASVGAQGGLQPGQPPPMMRSPAQVQQNQGALGMPEPPLPDASGAVQIQ